MNEKTIRTEKIKFLIVSIITSTTQKRYKAIARNTRKKHEKQIKKSLSK